MSASIGLIPFCNSFSIFYDVAGNMNMVLVIEKVVLRGVEVKIIQLIQPSNPNLRARYLSFAAFKSE